MINDKYYTTYKVEQGDTLFSIAKKFNINQNLLATLNGINLTDYIYSNQELLLPKKEYSYYITKEGDSLDTVSNMFECNNYDLLDNNLIYLMPGQLLLHKKDM